VPDRQRRPYGKLALSLQYLKLSQLTSTPDLQDTPFLHTSHSDFPSPVTFVPSLQVNGAPVPAGHLLPDGQIFPVVPSVGFGVVEPNLQ
jgi:hypothetical protein